MSSTRDLIARALLQPKSLTNLSALQWDLLVRQGRRAHLLARLAYRLKRDGFLECVPDAPRNHLSSALRMAERQSIALRWEVQCICQALQGADVKVTLLKGAAYVIRGLDVAHGRTFSDVDILVPKEKLGHVESELMIHGWQGGYHDAYDQRYYRSWMHEIPPMRHVRRGTTIDVHHTILPETARVKVNTAELFEGLVPTEWHPNVFVLRPTDMLLHSAAHLFHEGDFEKALRDLFDLECMLDEFGGQEGFWEELVPRANVLGLNRPLYYALHFTVKVLGTQVPAHVMDASRVGAPAAGVGMLMDYWYGHVLRPQHASTQSFGASLARFSLYVRSHWIRMPLHLLILHLGRKAFVRPNHEETEKSLKNIAPEGADF